MRFEIGPLKKPSTALLIGLFAVLVLLVVEQSRTISGPSTTWPSNSPDEFANYFQSIRTVEGELAPTYKPGYRMGAFENLIAAAKGGGRLILPWVERGPANVGGRTRAIIVDLADPAHATWIAGSVAGGIWRTTNKGISWISMTDHLPRLSIGALAQAPSRPSVMYAGTGEGYPNGDAAIGDGMFKSTDGGLTWATLSSTLASYDFLFVNRIIVSPLDDTIVMAATNSGLFRSLDGGAIWNKVKAAATSRGFYQIVHKPGDFSVQYAVEKRSGIWKSVDSGSNWSLMNQGLTEATEDVRIELDISPVNPNRLIALVENTDGPEPIYFSDNAAATWVPFLVTTTGAAVDIAGTQGWYDLMVKAHPFNQDIVFLGGIALYKATITDSAMQSTFMASQNGTGQFMSFVNFGGGQLGGGLRLGTDESESTITPEKMVPVEVRFGPGRSQMAHRFVPPDQAGVALSDYPYRDYVAVPFEVWDTQNNRQLMVSFRDRNDDGVFELIENSTGNIGREYVMIHATPYNSASPNASIAQNGGIVTDLAYFFWPTLAAGATWNPASLPNSTLRFFWVDQSVPSGSVSTIGGGIHSDQHVMVATPTTASNFQLVLGNDGGIAYSGDDGSNWIDRDRGYNTSQYYGIDKKAESNAFIGGTQDNGSWRSFVDPSASQFWNSAGGGDGFEAVWHKQNDQKLLVSSQWNFISRSLNGGGGFTSGISGLSDSGSEAAGAQFLTVLEQDPTDSEIIYTVGRSGVWRSTNFAASWTLTPIPIESWGFPESSPRAKIKVSLKQPNIVWAGAEMDANPGGPGGDNDGKLQLSINKGLTFTPVSTPSISPGRISGMATSFESAETVYVLFSASNRAKIIRSTDMGENWQDLSGFDPGPDGLVSQNGFPDVAVFDLLDFPNSTRLWAATEIGIIESLNDGSTWTIADNGLPAVSVWQIRLLDGVIVVATHGRGVWSVPVSSVPSVQEVITNVASFEVPLVTTLDSIYPNPVQSKATLTWNASQPGTARIQILDVQGRLVSSVFDGAVSAGRQESIFETSRLPSGIYFIRVEIGNTVLSKPFTRIK